MVFSQVQVSTNSLIDSVLSGVIKLLRLSLLSGERVPLLSPTYGLCRT